MRLLMTHEIPTGAAWLRLGAILLVLISATSARAGRVGGDRPLPPQVLSIRRPAQDCLAVDEHGADRFGLTAMLWLLVIPGRHDTVWSTERMAWEAALYGFHQNVAVVPIA